MLLTGLLGIVDVLLAGRLIAVLLPVSGLDIGNQVGVGIVLLAFAYVLGVFTNLALYQFPIFRKWYNETALAIYSRYEDRLRGRGESVLGVEMPGAGSCAADRARAASRLFDEVWGCVRVRCELGLEEYKVCVSWERLCRGCVLAFPVLIVMVALQWNRLGRAGALAAPAGEMWTLALSGVVVLLVVLFALAVYLLRYSVRLEYELLAVVFLGMPIEQAAESPQELGGPGIVQLLIRWLRGERV